MTNTSLGRRAGFGVVLIAVVAVVLAACGDDEAARSGEGGRQDARAVERAFLEGMVHHHGSAIAMAEIARRRGQAPFVASLAGDIVATQEQEIREMQQIYTRLFGNRLEPDRGAHDALGLTAEEAGMTHDEQTNEMLERADPFDRAFVDEMAPHHSGAVKMSEVVLENTGDSELRELAAAIVSTQEREILAMNAFRTRAYGAPVPEDAGHGGGGHSG